MQGSKGQHKIIILTAPSGAGKTSITRYLLSRIPQLSFSISAATRKAREGEVNGRDYYFISPEEFQKKIKNNEFVEWEMVYEGKYYGTLKSELDRLWKLHQYPLLDIDVKGAIHVQQQYPRESLSIFIEPPSVKELRRRLISRGSESEESLQTRLNKAEYELSFMNHFNKVVVNDDLEEACTEAEGIVKHFLGIKE
ncbi:guanylate kinase [Niabella ginsenosidivorans]|uniref:Guanylate kinase n=2 Tax=Niabella ginsenosidivorans TaxID=1176587 RepID=A0A1A9I7E6_9BACT|nr:guanylate kinase [Niabella ginsenosidivorans]